MEGSSLQVGIRHQRLPTDVRTDTTGRMIADQEASAVWVSVNQAITAKISAIIMGQFQHSRYGESSIIDGDEVTDNIFFAGATIAYQFNPHIAAEAGYTFDRLDSDFQFRSFTRNRIYVGTRLSY
jgi:hypothetical protein